MLRTWKRKKGIWASLCFIS